MAYKLLSDCPVCGDKLKAVKLTCSSCGTSIESEFSLSKFEQLTTEQLQFIDVFMKCRGSIKDVEKELGVSYPTVRARLNETVKALGYTVAEDEKTSDVRSIIDSIESGDLSAEEAIRKLKSK